MEVELFMGMNAIEKKHRDTLVKAVSIAKANGFDIDDSFFTEVEVEDALFDGMRSYYNIIFSHEFARAFWTDDTCIDILANDHEEGEFPQEVDLVDTLASGNHPVAGLAISTSSVRIPLWQYNLLQMALSDDPLMYIRSTLDEMDLL